MRVGYRRTEEHEERGVYVVDAKTGKGLLLHYDGEWDMVRREDLKGVENADQVLDRLINGKYIPIDIPDAEFNLLYERLSSSKLPIFMGEHTLPNFGPPFRPEETPTIRALIEEDNVAYLKRAITAMRP